ncbi:MAG: response regulator [Candidatus Omnitrophica bacterium]|nr:response regulator [Candidatus Omnitrophota bacterium]
MLLSFLRKWSTITREEVRNQGGGVENKKILLVDDEEEVVRVITQMLQRADYEVVSTTEGKEAFTLAKKHQPDLIILDVIMPGMRGEDIKRLLSEDEQTNMIPTLFLTGILTKEDEEFLKNLTGEVRSLAKPVTSQELLMTVGKILEGRA